ncbi:sensor histidine kinase [Streptomyces polygonati]|uniref:histidine kinase n=1 Tax=Streptomyces polygonati TaxID=1617087 RepID=A0ABV8HJR7_9ACTN
MDSPYQHRGPLWTEVALVVVLVGWLVQQQVAAAGARGPDVRDLVALAAALALPARWRLPLLTAGLAVAAMALRGAIEPVWVMLFHLAARSRVRPAVAFAAVVALLPLFPRPEWTDDRSPPWGPGVMAALALTAGLWWAGRRRLMDSLAAQVELRGEQARLAERARIAAEMHDVLAHRLSLLALHSGVLAMRADTLPPQVADRLLLLRTASTQALADLRDVLGVLRADEPPPGPGQAQTPVLQDLSVVLAEAREAGQTIAATVTGDIEATPAGHRLAVRRLVQEGLTNARKHAPGAAVRLAVHFGEPVTTVEVVNDPARTLPPPAVSSGYGLIGLDERVGGLHGRFSYGRTDEGGWRLAALIPLRAGTEPA